MTNQKNHDKKLNSLSVDFGKSARELLRLCTENGVCMKPYTAFRNPVTQTMMWCSGRKKDEIDAKVKELKSSCAPFLAYLTGTLGPSQKNHCTNAIAGLSWHQWGEALDCVWVVSGEKVWDIERQVNGMNGYAVYSDIAKSLGLVSGLHWPGLKDAVHVQLRSGSPLDFFSYPEIDGFVQNLCMHK
jgi:peptidoglycan L-alanyl-D-glutamate endopeptidase CwlK